VVMLPRFAVRASTCRRRYRPIWLRNNGLSYLVSRYFRLPAAHQSGWCSDAVLLAVSDGDDDSRKDHGRIRDRRIQMTVDRNRRHHAEPRQHVNAPTAFSLRDDPMAGRVAENRVSPEPCRVAQVNPVAAWPPVSSGAGLVCRPGHLQVMAAALPQNGGSCRRSHAAPPSTINRAATIR
jgi:hypothetical protein